jgi:hypothetical protein
MTNAHNNSNAVARYLIVFMNPTPYPNSLFKTYGPSEMFTAIWTSSWKQRKYADWPARTTLELYRRYNQERAFFRQFA